MAKPTVILVGADKGGVGKTTVARTLLDYFTAHQVPIRAFDTESPRGTLKRFHPDVTEVVDVTQVADQMKIFDTLGNAAGQGDGDRRARRPVVADPAGARPRSGCSIAPRRARSPSRCFTSSARRSPRSRRSPRPPNTVGDANYYLVKNFINNTTFFEWDPATYNSYFKRIKGAAEITMPKLNEMACEQVEVASTPFVSFVANKDGARRRRQLFVRAARLCAPLARQCLGRVRPRAI